MSWVKPVLQGGKLLVDLIKALKPGRRRNKPGPDVKPIAPDDLKKKT